MGRWYAQVAWEEVHHIDEKSKAELLESVPQYQKEARSKGIPTLGSGLIYAMAESDMRVPDFPIPDHWKRAFSFDTGWNWAACVWGAYNPEAKITYIYAAYKRGQADPATHVESIKARGAWIPGVADAADINKLDGRQMIQIYRDDFKLDLELPVKAVEAGIYKVWCALQKGTLKIFASCSPWFEEVRFYARDEKGEVVKKNDHLMDATRYLLMNGMDRAKVVPVVEEQKIRYISPDVVGHSWMGG
jgi:hypothetical protein